MARRPVETARAEQGAVARLSMYERLASKKPVTAYHDVVLDAEPLEKLREARSALQLRELVTKDEDLDTDPDVAAAREAVRAAEAAAEGASVRLHFRALPRAAYEALLLAHQRTDAKPSDDEPFDLHALLPALVAATIYDPVTDEQPVLTAEQVAGLFQTWNQGEVDAVWSQARNVCTTAPNPALPKGFAATGG